MAGGCSSSSGRVPGALLVGEGYLRWVRVREEAGDHLEAAAGEVEEASCPQEAAAGEVGTSLQKLARVEEAEDHRGDRGRGEGLQEQQLPVSAGRFKIFLILQITLDRRIHVIGII